MPILNLQAQFRELGRIRMGRQVEWQKNGRSGTRPDKLSTFRLTSPSRETLDRAATIYGGEVTRWEGAPEGEEWELVTTSPALDIVVPPGAATLSQWNEMWTVAGCARRCNGVIETISGHACLCPADPGDRNDLAAKGEACKPTTRLSVVLPNLPDVGIWILVSHGYYAAVELQGTANLLMAAGSAGRMLPARLRIDERKVKRPGEKTREFGVPVIEIGATMLELSGGELSPSALLPAGPTVPPAPSGDVPLPDDPSFATTARPTGDTTARPTGDAFEPETGTPTPPLPYEAFKRLVVDSGVDVDLVMACHRRRFPNGPTVADATDVQRGFLWQEITNALQGIVALPDGEIRAVLGRMAADREEGPAAGDGTAPGLTAAQFTDALSAGGVAVVFAESTATARFGVEGLDALSDQQRLALANELELFDGDKET